MAFQKTFNTKESNNGKKEKRHKTCRKQLEN